MLKITICDDDIQFVSKFENMLLSMAAKALIEVDTDVYYEGRELVKKVCEEAIRYDLIFLDNEIQDMNGLEVAKQIRLKDCVVKLIYLSNYESYAIEIFDVNPFQFLTKPIDQAKLNKYFLKAVEEVTAGNYYCSFYYKREAFRILVKDIMYIESDKRLVYIYTVDGRKLIYYRKLDILEEHLKKCKDSFWRIHKSFLVNTRYIIRKNYMEIELINGKVLYISEDRRKKIKDYYYKLIMSEII